MLNPNHIDTKWLLALNFDGGNVLDFLMYAVSWKFTWVPLYLAVICYIWVKNNPKTALIFFITTVLMILCADQTATFFKNHLPKLRPTHNPQIQNIIHTVYGYTGGLYGTVSSHAANAMAFAAISAFVIRSKIYTWIIALWVITTCYSRIYLGAHYPTDILWGIIDGAAWAVIWIAIYNYAKKRLIKT